VLQAYRVIDLTDHRGIFAAKVLAELGADVIKVEPPTGDPSRGIGPFAGDVPHPERSLFWMAHAVNRRSLTLDIAHGRGRDLLRRLVSSAHFLFESSNVGYLDSLGLGWDDLRRINPGLVYVSITPFGRTGPRSHAPATDLTGVALGGSLFMTGEPDLPPVRVSHAPQFWLVGSATAAAGAMVAHHHRVRTGEGQLVDVSCQQAIARTLSHAPQSWDMNRVIVKRKGAYRQLGSITVRITYPCADGYVACYFPGGPVGARMMAGLAAWHRDEGVPNAFIEGTDWQRFEFGTTPQAVLDEMDATLAAFFAIRRKRELAEGAVRHRVILFPVSDASDLLQHPQPRARGFWQPIAVPDIERTLEFPGPLVRVQGHETPARRAPRIGEHTSEILRDLGLTPAEIEALRAGGVA